MDTLSQRSQHVLPRKGNALRRYDDGESHHSKTVEDHYRHNYFDAIDLEVSSFDDCVYRRGGVGLLILEELLINAENKEGTLPSCKKHFPFMEMILMPMNFILSLKMSQVDVSPK